MAFDSKEPGKDLYMKLLNRFKNIVKNTHNIPTKAPLDSYGVLLEAGQGKNINGSMFSILKTLEQDENWKEYKPYFVVTEETKEKAAQRFSFYDFKKVQLVLRNTKEYWDLLYTCKYLMTDNSFPPAFVKKEGQVYLNTWHGTPLKYLGRSDIKNSTSLGNVQKNYFTCDYALFPNEHTRDVFMKDYMLERMFKGQILLADYPRNAALLDEEHGTALREKLGLTGKKILAYMPTWRGSGRIADGKEQIAIIKSKLEDIDAALKDDELLYVNLHFLVSEGLNFDNFTNILPFPSEYETYEFLNVCDVLITDYSSVFFDFAVTNKKIILFAYDKQEYLESKGMYLDIDSFPFPIVEDTKSLIEEIHSDDVSDRSDFQRIYCNYADKDVINKILKLVFCQDQGDLVLEKPYDNGKKNVLYHVGSLNTALSKRVIEHILKDTDYQNQNVTLCFEQGITPGKAEWLETLPKEIYYYSLVKTNPKLVKETIGMSLYLRTGIGKSLAEPFFLRENQRLFPGWDMDEINLCLIWGLKYPYVYEKFDIKKRYHQLPMDYQGVNIFRGSFVRARKFVSEHYDEVISYDHSYARTETNEITRCYNDTKFLLYQSGIEADSRELTINLTCRAKSYTELDFDYYRVLVNKEEYTPVIKAKKLSKKAFYRWKVKCSFSIPLEKLGGMELQNKIYLVDMKNPDVPKKNRILAIHLLKAKPSKLFFDDGNNLTGFLRYPKDTLTLTIRDKNVTDAPSERVKVAAAFGLSKLMFWYKPILLFEKNAARYEESASVVYEKLIDRKCKDVYFVLDKNYPFKNSIPEKYRDNIIDKYSFKHYLCFFCAKAFIGSESKIHAFELRPVSALVTRKLSKSKHSYIFLQHGVMYMVSLDAERRTFFKPAKNKNVTQKTVVSSQLELEHFVDLGGYAPENLYLCGLPKFDRNTWNEDADKIVVMLTWRPWEFIQGLEDIEQTSYFKMLEKIVSHIPEKYKDKLMVLPHPLIEQQMRSMDTVLKDYVPAVMKYDDILKETKILITDYSSISYDAFYRGVNVIFCWQEKEECIAEYGQNAKLMLTEELAFGDVNVDYEELPALIEDNYNSAQKQKHIDNYSKIVNFHDGHNTDRLIEMLIEDKII